jgi:hypothetical protein
MESIDARAYMARWQAVNEIEQKELRSTSLIENWRQLNAIKQRANRLGIKKDTNSEEMEVYLLWAKLKTNYVPTKQS